ncbi:SH3 domain-containing protein [Streptomyces sp. NBC_01174]|uniref:SH3 domain-containing protein n=1 Tax=Streptomyces sp. NBC_01174 TaxID=2903758 RepID=UPI002F912884|nr:SH3 domain-containing protein [Streptomyces sp. NBC_01174]
MPSLLLRAITVTTAAALLAGGATTTATASGVVGTSACGKTYKAGYWWTYPTSNANLRKGPSARHAALGIIHKGDGVEIRCLAKSNRKWARVLVLNGAHENAYGWMAVKSLH